MSPTSPAALMFKIQRSDKLVALTTCFIFIDTIVVVILDKIAMKCRVILLLAWVKSPKAVLPIVFSP